MEIIHGFYDAINPVLILKSISAGLNKMEVTGIININGQILNIGDQIKSAYIGKGNIKLGRKFRVDEIKERFSERGNFLIDVSNSGFTAIVSSI